MTRPMSAHGFNLLQGDLTPPDIWDNIYAWVNKIGRLIVILVQVVVIGSFVARVVIDTQTKELLEEEKKNTVTLSALAPQERKYRDMQNRFLSYKEVWHASSTYNKVIVELITGLPKDTKELSVNISGDVVTVKGISAADAISKYEKALKASSSFSDVQLTELSSTLSSSASKSEFSLQIKIKDELIHARTVIGES
jgi:Tfp pilus assembly protein PilN